MLFLKAVFGFFLNTLICLLIFNIVASYVIEYMSNEDNNEEDDYENHHWKNKY